jgi:hypothetical protein
VASPSAVATRNEKCERRQTELLAEPPDASLEPVTAPGSASGWELPTACDARAGRRFLPACGPGKGRRRHSLPHVRRSPTADALGEAPRDLAPPTRSRRAASVAQRSGRSWERPPGRVRHSDAPTASLGEPARGRVGVIPWRSLAGDPPPDGLSVADPWDRRSREPRANDPSIRSKRTRWFVAFGKNFCASNCAERTAFPRLIPSFVHSLAKGSNGLQR